MLPSSCVCPSQQPVPSAVSSIFPYFISYALLSLLSNSQQQHNNTGLHLPCLHPYHTPLTFTTTRSASLQPYPAPHHPSPTCPPPIPTPLPPLPHPQDTMYAFISDRGPSGCVINTEAILDAQQLPVGIRPPESVTFPSGLCFCTPDKSKNRIHRIQTPETNACRLCFIGAEIIGSMPASPGDARRPPLSHPGYTPVDVDHPVVRAYKVTVAPGSSTGPVTWQFSGVVIVLCGSLAAEAFANKRPLEWASTFWFDGPLTVDFSNATDGAAEVCVVEWL